MVNELGETMKMRMDSPDVRVPTAPTVSVMREESNGPTSKSKKKARVKENKQVMKNITVSQQRRSKKVMVQRKRIRTTVRGCLNCQMRSKGKPSFTTGASGLSSSKKQSAEWPTRETISMECPKFKSYWAQWSMLVIRDGLLFRKWESERRDHLEAGSP